MSVESFVPAHINSVEQISVLVALRSDPARQWSIAELSLELRSVASAIERRLEDLYAAGVLSREGRDRVRFVPASPEMARAIDELVTAYRDRPNRIIELIYSQPPSNLHAFADAFMLKKKEK